MKILVLGGGGRLGAALAEKWGERHEVRALGRSEADLRDFKALRSVLADADFDVLVNSAALTSVDYCQEHEEEAFAVNGEVVEIMAELCRRKQAKLIQISTDYVFDGIAREPCTEDTEPRPISLYGASKLLGERLALEPDPGNLVVRVSWIFGPHRESFLESMLRRALRDDQVEAISDKWSAPSYSIDLATLMEPLLERGTGVVHLCNEGGCTWQEYGQAALTAAVEAGWPLKTQVVEPVALKSMGAFRARRPVYTVMATDRYREWTGQKPRPWQEAVAEYVRTLDPSKFGGG